MATSNSGDESAIEHVRGDRFTKQIIIFTLCGIAILFAVTVCGLSAFQKAIPDSLDRLITSVTSVLGGMLIKTGVDRVFDSNNAMPIKAAETLPVQDVADSPAVDSPAVDSSPADSPAATAKPDDGDGDGDGEVQTQGQTESQTQGQKSGETDYPSPRTVAQLPPGSLSNTVLKS